MQTDRITKCLRNQGRTKGEGWSTAPSNFIAGRPKAALLFWFSGGFRCRALLLLSLLYMNIEIGKIDVKCYTSR